MVPDVIENVPLPCLNPLIRPFFFRAEIAGLGMAAIDLVQELCDIIVGDGLSKVQGRFSILVSMVLIRSRLDEDRHQVPSAPGIENSPPKRSRSEERRVGKEG